MTNENNLSESVIFRDGTHWSVEIFTIERTIKKYGDNMFPQELELFCKAIGRITNRKFH